MYGFYLNDFKKQSCFLAGKRSKQKVIQYEKVTILISFESLLRTVIYRLNDLAIGNWKNVHSDKGRKFYLSEEFMDIVNECKRSITARVL